MQVPIALPNTSCAMCGGTLRQAGGRAAAGGRPAESSAASDEVQRQAEQIISAILPADLLEDIGGQSKPADEDVVAALPLVKIEPYVALRATRMPCNTSASSAVAPPRRELLAEAAERRAEEARASAGSAAAATATATPPPPVLPQAETAAEEADAEASAPPTGAAAPVPLELQATASAFGTPLAELGDAGVCGPLVVAEPRDGAGELRNASRLQGKLVLMWRGGCSFVDKVRRAQQAGAAGAIIVQHANQKWPFTMSDTANAGTDVELPSLMVCADDGARLLAELEVAQADSERDVVWCVARAHHHHTSCAVCLQEMMAEEMAVRLPCAHYFHEECVRQWLKKQHTCPCCRSPLPPKAPSGRSHEADDDAPQGAVPTWADFSVPGGNAPMPSSAMYT